MSMCVCMGGRGLIELVTCIIQNDGVVWVGCVTVRSCNGKIPSQVKMQLRYRSFKIFYRSFLKFINSVVLILSCG